MTTQTRNFTFTRLAIPDVVEIERHAFDDERGFNMEAYKESVFREAGLDVRFVQDNVSHSKRGVLRGLHYQRPPYEHGKLVSCLQGEIFDVAVDLRPDSPTFGEWVGRELSARNRRMLFVPAGFAHGFQVLGEEALVSYKLTGEYAPAADAGVRWDDPDIGIEWPLANPVLSAKDRNLPSLEEVRNDFRSLQE